MGNSLTCFAPKGPRQKASRWSHNPASITQLDDRKIETAPRSSSSSVKKEIIDDEILRQQAVAAVLLLKQHQQQQNGSFPQFDRSTSVQYPLTSSKKQNKLPRSSSSRPSSLLDPLSHHLNNQVSIINYALSCLNFYTLPSQNAGPFLNLLFRKLC